MDKFRADLAASRLMTPDEMEYVDGRDLGHVVTAQGPLPVEQAVDRIIQAARGLAYAHHKDIIHRDIKPQNLLLAVSDQPSAVSVGENHPKSQIDNRQSTNRKMMGVREGSKTFGLGAFEAIVVQRHDACSYSCHQSFCHTSSRTRTDA